jgi:general secretion pathway protein D
MDVELTDSYRLGVSALMTPQKTGDLTSTAGNSGGASFLSGVTNLASDLKGFNYWGMYKGDLMVAVKALSANSRGHVLATPRVQTTHAVPAIFDVTDEIPYVGTLGGAAGTLYYSPAQVQFAPVQTSLSVTPYITPDGLVVMDVDQQISDATLIDLSATGAGKAPRTTTRSTTSTVSVESGETVILGGYIRTSKSRSKSGVPILKDIPLLGGLFRSTSRDSSRSELMVLIRPTVLPSPKDAARLAEDESSHLPGVREMQKEMREDEQRRQEKADRVTGKQ